MGSSLDTEGERPEVFQEISNCIVVEIVVD
jgi:hypothetical protein